MEASHAAIYSAARSVHAALQTGNRDEAMRHASDLSRLEQEFVGKLDTLNAILSQAQS